MKAVKHIFFDLDHTLWDFEKNSTEAIAELFHEYELHHFIGSFQEFVEAYQVINARYWTLYNRGEIDKHTVRYGRFYEIFKQYAVANHIQVAENFADHYLQIAPTKTNLFPGTHEVLAALKNRYPLHLITNGFKEVLYTKIQTTGIDVYFDSVLSAEDVGVNKPHERVFTTALNNAGAIASESVMIGDSFEADILGAEKVGMHTIHFNPKKEEKQTNGIEIHDLRELLNLFSI